MEILNKDNFNEKISQDKLVLVDFFATWCMPCRMLAPILEELSAKYTDIDFCKVDIDESMDIAKEYRIFSVPSVLLFKKGEKIDSIIGFNNEETVIEFLEKNK